MDRKNAKPEEMDKKTDNAIKRYIKLIREKYPQIEAIFLFGSYARGVANEDSDIDLAIVFRHLDESQRFDLQVQLMILAAAIDTRIEPHPFAHEQFYSDNPFAVEIKRTGLEIA